VKPLTVSVLCGGECFEGSPPAAIKVKIDGEFILSEEYRESGLYGSEADLSGFTGEFGLTRVGITTLSGGNACCLYATRSPNMEPYLDLTFGFPGTLVPVESQSPDMWAYLCSNGTGSFSVRLGGATDVLYGFGTGNPQAVGFSYGIIVGEGDRLHLCKSPWGLPHVYQEPNVMLPPNEYSVPFINNVTPPPSVILWW